MSTDQDTFVNGIEILTTDMATSSSASLFTFGGISILSTTNATVTSASFLTLGGSYIQGNTIIGGNTVLLSTTPATNTSTGALTIPGGIGITGSIYGNLGNFNFIQTGISASIPSLVATNISASTLAITYITCQNLYSTNTITSQNLLVSNFSTNSLYINSTSSGTIPTIFGYNSNNTTATGLAFSSWNGTTFIEKARFDTIGNFLIKTTNIGIGTTNPTYLLDVSGDVRFTGNLTIGTSLFTPIATIGSLSSTNISLTNLTTTNSFVTNLTSTNSIITNLTSTNSVITNLTSTNSVITNLTSINSVITNLTSTNSTCTNLRTTNATISNINISSITTNNLLVAGSTQNIAYIDSQNSQVNYGQIIFKNTNVTGDLKISGDRGDVQWQGGSGRALQMGNYHEIRLLGGRNTTANISFVNGSNGTYNTIIQNSNDSIALTVQANSTQNADLTQWTNSSSTVLSSIDNLGNLHLNSTSDSINSTTGGTIITFGGISIGKSVDIGSTTIAINNSTGALTVAGGGGFNGNIYANNMFVYRNTTDASVALTPSPLTTKGDIYTFATSGSNLPVGTYAQTLISNTNANTGLQWVSPLTQKGFYGSEYHYVSDKTTSSVTTTTGTLKTSLTTGTLVGGTYKIEINYNIAPNTSITQNNEVAVYLNTNSATGFNAGSTTANRIYDSIYRPTQTTFNIPFSNNIVQTFGNSIQTIGLYYRTLVNGQTINIAYARILLYRIQ